MNEYLKRAKQMRKQLNSIISTFTDKQAINNKELYQNWSGNGIQVAFNDVFLYNEDLYRVIQSKEIKNIKQEQTLVIYALRACLDGLHQQHCNGKVTDAIDKVDKYINQAAHNEDL